VHGHEFDRRDAELLQVVNDRRVGQGTVLAAQLLGNCRVQLGQALDVGFVDDALGIRDVRGSVSRPVEERIDHHAVHHVLRGVVVVLGVRVAEVVGEQRLVPVDLAAGRLGVGVEQQLRRVEPLARGWVVVAVHAVAVALSGLDGRKVRVPDVGVHLGEFHAGFRQFFVEQAEFDLVCCLTVEREVGAVAVEGCAERVRGSWPAFHVSPLKMSIQATGQRRLPRGGYTFGK
jgi:hypothetical protein